MLRIAFMFAALAAAGQAQASGLSNLDGKNLLKVCTSEEMPMQMACWGWVNGTVNGVLVGIGLVYVGQSSGKLDMEELSAKHMRACLPLDEGDFDPVPVVVTYMQDNPSEQDRSAAANILRALTDAYPC